MNVRSLIDAMPSALNLKTESVPTAASYVTNGAVFTFGALTLNQVLAITGAVLAIATFVVNTYYQRRRDRREAELHRKRMSGESDNDKRQP